MEFTEKIILNALNGQFLSQPKYTINNLFVFNWGSDYLALTKAGYWYEVEVKISRADFKNDFKNKKRKHNFLKNRNIKKCPNYFYYAVPEDLIEESEVPEYAGLIYVNKYRGLKTIKKAPIIHKNKLNLDLSDKFYYNWIGCKIKYDRLEEEVRYLRNKINKHTNEKK